ncbi:MAG: PKD domain-containing protein [Candidatus Diapherotrites archaeon]
MKKLFAITTIIFATMLFSEALAAGAPTAKFTYTCNNLYPPGYGDSFTLDASSSTFPNGQSNNLDAYTWYIKDESISNACHMTLWHPKVTGAASLSGNWCYDTGSTGGLFETDVQIQLTVKDSAGQTNSTTQTVHVKKVCLSCLCVKKTCAEVGWACGSGTETNCNKTISCGTCPSGQTCSNHQCVSCTPKTCGEMGWSCGSGTETRCNSYISCGPCSSGYTCTNHSCVPSCTAYTCPQVGWDCGTGDNGCSGTLSCGSCPSGYTCTNHQCISNCNPSTCSGMGWSCGSGTEPCGNTINCGSCSSGYTCTNHDCQCSPKTCAQMGWQCGTGTETNCGNPISCGSCPSGKICDDSTHKCVPGCVAKTCAGMGWACGTGTETGCNTYLSCPNCTGYSECTGHQCICTPKTCNEMGWECGTGTENKCNTPLNCLPCPAGKTCNNSTHKCECLPKTCAQMGWDCYTGTETNCNTSINCGTCPATQTCQNNKCCTPKTCAQMGWNCGSGTETGCNTVISCGDSGGCTGTGVCIGHNCCTPKTCADFPGKCGSISDGCGGTINCNSNCIAPQLCIGGTCCAPKTCAQLGFDCGTTTESNCGTSINCGTCTAGTCIGNKCNKAPKASFTASPDIGFAPLTVEFKSTSTDSEGDALQYWWDFNTADSIAVDIQGQAEVTHVYTTPGAVTARLTVKDPYNGQISVEKTLSAKELAAVSAFTATNPKNKNETTEVAIACNKDVANVKIEYLDKGGNPAGLQPDNLPCGPTTAKITKPAGFFQVAGIYLVKAAITSEACGNCPKTTNIAVGTEMPPLFTPEIHPALIALIAMAVLMLAQKKSRKIKKSARRQQME